MRRVGMRLTSFLMPFMLLGFSLLSGLALAEKADQDKPLILNADSVSINDVEQKYRLQGDILLIKGSIVVKADEEMPLSSLTNRRGPMIGWRR